MKINKIKIDAEEIQGMIRSYFKNLYSPNLKVLRKWTITWITPHNKPNQYERNKLNRPISPKKTEIVFRSLAKKKKQTRTRWLQCRILLEFQRIANTDTPEFFHTIETEGASFRPPTPTRGGECCPTQTHIPCPLLGDSWVFSACGRSSQAGQSIQNLLT